MGVHLRKKSVILFILLTLMALLIQPIYSMPNVTYNCNKETLFVDQSGFSDNIDQQQSNHSEHAIQISNESWRFAQRFKPSYQILTKLSIFIAKQGLFPSDATITISLRKILRREMDQVEIPISSINSTGKWVECDFNFHVLDINESYYIVLQATKIDRNNFINWYFANDNPYPNGEVSFSEDNQEWSLYIDHNEFENIDLCFKTYGVENSAPQIPKKPDGPTEGQYDKPYTYSTSSLDPDENNLYYKWDWGDGEISKWIGPYDSEEKCEATHSWIVKGSYMIKVKTKDEWGIETDWSDPLTIRMKKSKIQNFQNNNFFSQLFSNIFCLNFH